MTLVERIFPHLIQRLDMVKPVHDKDGAGVPGNSPPAFHILGKGNGRDGVHNQDSKDKENAER